MTSEPKQKKVKTELNPTSDATVNIQIASNKIPGALIDENHFFIESQGESSVDVKLNRALDTNDRVVLIKDYPSANLYKGYCCDIISVVDKNLYEIEFFSTFEENDFSLKSQKRHPNFEYPCSSYTMCVSSEDIIRLVNQDLYYQTCFF